MCAGADALKAADLSNRASGVVVGKLGTAEITKKAYMMACRSASSYEECMDLVYLAGKLGETLKTLVHVPLIGGLLRTMRGPAHATGFGALQEFLETGFATFRRIPDIDRFLEQLVARLDEIFERIYHKPSA